MHFSSSLYITIISSPIGDLLLGDFQDKLCLVSFYKNEDLSKTALRVRHLLRAHFIKQETDLLREVQHQLHAYFSQKRRHFDLPLLLLGTDFQKSVWQVMGTIPYGTTMAYKDIAVKVVCPRAVRAVGSASGANALPIIIPCHRVINRNGAMGGYDGGLAIKRFLLHLEKGL